MSGLRSGSDRFTTANRQLAIDLEESFRQAAAERRRNRAVLENQQGPPSTGATPTPTPANSRPPTPPPPAEPVVPVINMPDIVNFEDENGTDDNRALQEATRALDKLQWNDCDVPFFFAQAEIKMGSVGAKKQFTKFQVLSSILPPKVIEEVKDLLCLQETEFTDNDAYKQLKTEVLRIFGPKPEDAIERALSRVLVGKPSQLARALVRGICKKKLRGCGCCPPIVMALWKICLSTAVKAGIAHC